MFYELLIGRTQGRHSHKKNKSCTEAGKTEGEGKSFRLFSNPKISEMVELGAKDKRTEDRKIGKEESVSGRMRIRKLQHIRSKSEEKNGEIKLNVKSLGMKINTPYSKYISFFSTFDALK